MQNLLCHKANICDKLFEKCEKFKQNGKILNWSTQQNYLFYRKYFLMHEIIIVRLKIKFMQTA